MEKIRRAVLALKASGTKLTQAAVFRQADTSRAAVYHYPKAKALLDSLLPTRGEVSSWYRLRRELILLKRVQIAAGELTEQGLPITHNALYKALSISRSSLANQPRVVAAISMAAASYKRDEAVRLKVEREGELLERVEDTILRLRGSGVSVTQAAVCAEMGLTAAGLRYYPAVCARLEQLVNSNGPRGKRRRRQ